MVVFKQSIINGCVSIASKIKKNRGVFYRIFTNVRLIEYDNIEIKYSIYDN